MFHGVQNNPPGEHAKSRWSSQKKYTKQCFMGYNTTTRKSLAIWSFLRRFPFFTVQSTWWTCKVHLAKSAGWTSTVQMVILKERYQTVLWGTKQPPKVLGHLVLYIEISIFFSPVHQVNMQSPDGPLKRNILWSFTGDKTNPQSRLVVKSYFKNDAI